MHKWATCKVHVGSNLDYGHALRYVDLLRAFSTLYTIMVVDNAGWFLVQYAKSDPSKINSLFSFFQPEHTCMQTKSIG